MPTDDSEDTGEEQTRSQPEPALDATRAYMADPPSVDAPQTIPQLGEFRLVRELGRGGMGAVYEAEDASLGRRVALKVLRFGALGDTAAVERFQREAATVAKLHHTNIVPIFSVGARDGVHYYAMQLVEGRNLAEVLRGGPADFRRAAQWGLAAAEALAHAHRHGVIHRDVKPSNLIVDAAERIWLTDFGLARSLDDAALTATDAMLGTPRYMSPEQASLKRDEIDARTDIYSLGATLYELITGRPPFDGDTSHQVIHAILTDEADPPRQVRADVPRDLDTVVMKCLAKDRTQRYATAADLADDLRAFLDGRTIRARRPGAGEQAIRWVRQRRRGLVISLGSVLATVAIAAVAAVAFEVRRRDNLGSVAFDTRWPPLTVDLVGEIGAPVESVGVPTRQPIDVASGNYQIHLSGERRFAELMSLSVPRAKKQEFELALEDQLLAPADEIPRAYFLSPGNGRTNIVQLSNRGINAPYGYRERSGWGQPFVGEPPLDATQAVRMDEATPRPMSNRWRVHSWLPEPFATGCLWPWDTLTAKEYSSVAEFDLRPSVPDKAVDFDGDGYRDYVLAARHQAWLCALSAKGGGSLWFVGRGSDLETVVDPAQRRQAGLTSAVLGAPLVTGDLDGDGVDELLVTFVDRVAPGTSNSIKRWIETISGAHGKTIWRYDLDTHLFELPQSEDPPYCFRWFFNLNTGPSSWNFSEFHANEGNIRRRDRRGVERGGGYVYAPQPPEIVRWQNRQVVCLLAGKHAVLIDLRNGQPVEEPMELPVRPGRPVVWADVDGDDVPEVLAIAEHAAPKYSDAETEMFAFSLSQRKALWREDIDAAFSRRRDASSEIPSWPVVADLDGDGRFELLAPNGSSHCPGGIKIPPPWGELEARDAASGARRWKARLMNMDQQVDRFLVGPDIDADGCRDVFATGLWGTGPDLYVDALSGLDGHAIWRGRLPGLANLPGTPNSSQANSVFINRLEWWSAGADGWPRLLVDIAVGTKSGENQSVLAQFSSSNGDLLTTAVGIKRFELADVDGDGADDLLHFSLKNDRDPDLGGTVELIGGASTDFWRRLGPSLQPVADFDGDGVTDLAELEYAGEQSVVTAIAGATGTRLWTTRLTHGGHATNFRIQPCAPPNQTPRSVADLDGDGTADMFAVGEMPYNGRNEVEAPLWALSGKTGRILWRAKRINAFGATPLLTSADLEGDGGPEVVLMVATDLAGHATPGGGRAEPLRLCLLSGRDGAVKWQQDVAPKAPRDELRRTRVAATFGDLNGDGVADVIVPGSADAAGFELFLRAFDGASGELLWNHKLPDPFEFPPSFKDVPPPLVADLDKDGMPETYSLELTVDGEPGQRANADLRSRITGSTQSASTSRPMGTWHARLHSLRAGNGEPLWTWQTEIHSYQSSPRPQRVRRRHGADWLCLNLHGNDDLIDPKRQPRYMVGLLAVVDAQGQLVQIKQVRGNIDYHVWPIDVDGDGDDEIVCLHDDKLQAVKAADGAVVWETAIEVSIDTDMLVPVPRPNGAPVIPVRDRPGAVRLRGFDGATGKRIWTCTGPLALQGPPRQESGGVSSQYVNVETALLDASWDLAPRHVYFGWESTSLCRPAVGLGQPPRQTPAPPPLTADPRLARPLPWLPEWPDSLSDARLFAWMIFQSLGLVVVPGWFLWGLIRRRQWSMRTLLLAPVVAGFGAAAWLAPLPRAAWPTTALASSLIVFAVYLSGVVFQRRWRVLIAWLALSLVFSVALAAWRLKTDAIFEGQYYAWTGWYWIFAYGGYFAAAIVWVTGLMSVAISPFRR